MNGRQAIGRSWRTWCFAFAGATLLAVGSVAVGDSADAEAAGDAGDAADPGPTGPAPADPLAGSSTVVVQDRCPEFGSSTPLGVSPSRRLAATACGQDDILRIWNVAGGGVLHRFAVRDDLESGVFSPDERFLATRVLGSGRELIWDLATGRALGEVSHDSPDAPVFSADGTHLMTVVWSPSESSRHYGRGTWRVLAWNTGTQALEPAVALGPEGERGAGSVCCSFSPDGRRAAAVFAGTLEVHDTGTGDVVFSGGPAITADLPAFDSTGTLVAAFSPSKTVRIFDLAARGAAVELEDHAPGEEREAGIERLAFAPDGKLLAAGGGSGWVRVWNPRTGRLAWEADVDAALTAASSQEVRDELTERFGEWSSESDCYVWNGHVPFEPGGLLFSPDGRTLLVHGLLRWKAADGRFQGRLAAIEEPHTDLFFAPGGRGFGVLDECPRILVPEPQARTTTACAATDLPSVGRAAASADGRLAVEIGEQWWTVDLAHAPLEAAAALPVAGRWSQAVPSPDGKRIVWVAEEGGRRKTRMIEVASGRVRDLPVPTALGGYREAFFSRDATRLTMLFGVTSGPETEAECLPDATAFVRYEIRQWSVESLEPTAALEVVGMPLERYEIYDPYRGTDVDPTGRFVAMVTGVQTIHVWDLQRRELQSVVRSARESIEFERARPWISPGGRLLLCQNDDHAPLAFDAVAGTAWPPEGGLSFPQKVDPQQFAFGPDGRTFAAVSAPGRVDVWSLETGRRLAELHAGDLPVESIGFSPDGTLLFGTDASGELWVWDGATATLRGSVAGAGRLVSPGPAGPFVLTRGETQLTLFRLSDLAHVHVVLAPNDAEVLVVAFTDAGAWDSSPLPAGREDIVRIRAAGAGSVTDAPLTNGTPSSGLLREFLGLGASPAAPGEDAP